MPARLPPHFGVLVAIACALASVGWLSAFITDDAAITLRYAANLAAGHGIRWNPGEHPVEGYSNFSHVLLGAAALKLGLPALTTLRVLNQLCVALASVVTYALGLRVLGSRLAASAAAVLVAAHPALAYWGSSGLESASYV